MANLAFFLSYNPGLNVQIWNSPQGAKPFYIDPEIALQVYL